MLVQVKQEHIYAAEVLTPKDLVGGERCPIAIALACMGFADATVGDTFVCLFGDNGCDHDLPPNAQRFVRDYDNAESVRPFSFILEE